MGFCMIIDYHEEVFEITICIHNADAMFGIVQSHPLESDSSYKYSDSNFGLRKRLLVAVVCCHFGRMPFYIVSWTGQR